MATVAPEFLRREVAAHYDDLDRFYREVWGEHVHHGLWLSRRDSSAAAVRNLVDLVAKQAQVQRGEAICDVGCGYGGTARVLANEYGAEVTALTVSKAQHEFSLAHDEGTGNPTYLLRDWLENDLPAASFDAVIAIESSEHMPNLASFFSEVARVLKPGGRFVVCAWLATEEPRSWERRWLLEPICREGRLRGMETATEYHRLVRSVGLVPTDFQDISRQVKRTWPICAQRVVRGFLQNSSYRQFLFQSGNPNRIFALTLLRIWLAYELGTMRYGVLTALKGARADAGQ